MQSDCPECNGSGVVYFYHSVGVEGRREYGCWTCDGLGYIEDEENDDE